MQQTPYNPQLKDEIKSPVVSKDTPEEFVMKVGSDCDKCGHCCKYDTGIVREEDIAPIAKHLKIHKDKFMQDFLVEKNLYNKKVWKFRTIKQPGRPWGKCMFYDDHKGCTIHPVKPLHCKIGDGCGAFGQQVNIWFTLNHVVDPDDPEAIRQWAQYLKTHPSIPGGELHDLVPDKIKLQKILNYEILR